MTATAEAYPLHWPDGWPRSEYVYRARYHTQFGKALDHLVGELRKFHATHIVISSDVPLRRDGYPYASQAASHKGDQGVAVYFAIDGERPGSLSQQVIACDHWNSVRDNLHACGLTIAAMRMIERTGATDIIKRAFSGFKQLPAAPVSADATWWEVLRIDPGTATPESINTAYRKLARVTHPDTGGTVDGFNVLTEARDRALLVVQAAGRA